MFSNCKLYSSYSLKENDIYEDKPCYISCLGTDFLKSGRLFLRDCSCLSRLQRHLVMKFKATMLCDKHYYCINSRVDPGDELRMNTNKNDKNNDNCDDRKSQ